MYIYISKKINKEECLNEKKKKEFPAIGETWVLSLAWEDPLEKGKASLENSMDYTGLQRA